MIISYLNMNFIRNKLKNLKILISDSVDILCIAESKVYELLLNNKTTLEGFKKPYQLDVTESSGVLLIYVYASLISKIINYYDFQKDIQCITIELNIVNKKHVIFFIYRPTKQNINYFLDSLSEGLDFYSKHYKNI